jgi:hypothetical protein
MRVSVRLVARHRGIVIIISTFLLKFVVARTSLEVYRLPGRSIDVVPGITWFQNLMRSRSLPSRAVDGRSPDNLHSRKSCCGTHDVGFNGGYLVKWPQIVINKGEFGSLRTDLKLPLVVGSDRGQKTGGSVWTSAQIELFHCRPAQPVRTMGPEKSARLTIASRRERNRSRPSKTDSQWVG